MSIRTEAKQVLLVVVALFVAAGCGVADVQVDGVGDDTAVTGDELRKNDPCAVVRCAAGTHCVAKGRRASCVADAPSCTSDADCRLFDNYCDGCSCQALSNTQSDPVCSGTIVNCFAQPCMNKTAVCSAGSCVLQ